MRVLLADDHPAYLRGLVAILTEAEELEVVATAADGTAALEFARTLRPEVVVMDLHLPGVDGIEATRRILAAVPGTAVLVLTMYDDDASLRAAIAAGARGYLLKESSGPQITHAIRAVARGEAVFGAAIADRVLGRIVGAVPTVSDALGELSARELDVLRELAQGATNRDIARRLVLSEKTVRNYVSTVLAKLGVEDRAAAARKACEAGLVVDDRPSWKDTRP
ncbi:response regulator [Streptomyces sp. NPDC055722]